MLPEAPEQRVKPHVPAAGDARRGRRASPGAHCPSCGNRLEYVIPASGTEFEDEAEVLIVPARQRRPVHLRVVPPNLGPVLHQAGPLALVHARDVHAVCYQSSGLV